VSRGLAIVLTLAAGAVVSLQPPANAALSEHVSDLGASLVSLAIALVIIAVLLLAVGHPGRLSGLSSFRPEHTLGGIGGAAVVTIGLIAVRPLGTAAVIALLVSSQVVASALSDQLGWFGHHVTIGPGRALGVALVIAGTALVTRT
jgi:uncharacterized membrane protein YdcZ (DUF606 family)